MKNFWQDEVKVLSTDALSSLVSRGEFESLDGVK